MSNISDIARIETILSYINDIQKIVHHHDSIDQALSDLEGQYALLMCIQQIGEITNKIKSENFKSKIPIKNIVGFRNIIVHNYDGINFQIVNKVISYNIPELKEILENLLKKEKTS